MTDCAQPTRRGVLTGILAALAAPLFLALGGLAASRRRRHAQQRVVLPLPDREGVTLHEEVVLIRDSAGGIRGLSARCPHLGCRINRVDHGVLVCPCHGSHFDLDGNRLSGPAVESLAVLSVTPREDQPELLDVDLR